MRKTIKALLAAAVLTVISATSVFAGSWQQKDGRYWYQISQNGFYQSGVYGIDGAFYGFDGQGYMLTGWQQPGGSYWYYFTPSGAAQIGWFQDQGKYYYFDAANNGAMRCNSWLEDNGKLYYFGADGAMKVNEFFTVSNSEGKTYCYKAMEDGHIRRNEHIDADSNGNAWRFLNDGVVMYRSAASKAAGYDDDWRYYLGQTDEQAKQKAEDEQQALVRKNETIQNHRDKADEIMDRQYTKYRSIKTSSSSRRAQNIASWEKRTRESLAKYLDESDINRYISSVKNNSYYQTNILHDDDDDEDEEEDYDYDWDWD